jgi:hypothetical protein
MAGSIQENGTWADRIPEGRGGKTGKTRSNMGRMQKIPNLDLNRETKPEGFGSPNTMENKHVSTGTEQCE